MMIVRFLLGILFMITEVIIPECILLELDELSILGFLCLQENRYGLYCFHLILSYLSEIVSGCSKTIKMLLKMLLKRLENGSKALLLHLYSCLKNQVKSLVFELRCNSSCNIGARDLVSALNRVYFLHKRGLSQRLPAAIFRAREPVFSINSYLYRAKQKRRVQQCVYVHSRLLFYSSLNS